MYGTGLYRRGEKPGTLIAEWLDDQMVAAEAKRGTGFATGGPSEGFAGTYLITYETEEMSIDLDLIIKAKGPNFLLSWHKDGKLIDEGIGFQSGDMLILGYQSPTA